MALINRAYLEDASGLVGHAERLFIPRNEEEIVEVLRSAGSESVGVTISGARTGLAGGSVPQDGWVLSMERFTQLEIQPGHAVAGPGVILRELQRASAATGQFYAPDPTEQASFIGGNIGTNASGSRSFRYPSRLEIVAAHFQFGNGCR